MKRIGRIIILFVFLQWMGCTGCCENYECTYGELESVEFRAFNNAGPEPVEITIDTMPALAFILQLTFRGTKTECPENASNHGNPFISSAYAYKCIGPDFQSPDTIVSLTITSNQTFNENYPAGEDLTPLFVTKVDDGFLYGPVGWTPDLERNYYLFSKPSETATHRFFAELVLSDGRLIKDSTNFITLVP